MRTHTFTRRVHRMFGMLLAGVLAGHATRAVGSERLQFDGDRMSAQIVQTPLSAVLEEFGRLSGAEVQWRGEAGVERVSTEFSGLGMVEGLSRLLGSRSYFLVYAGNGQEARLCRVVIMGSAAPTLGATPLADAMPLPVPPAPDAMVGDDPDMRMALVQDVAVLDPASPERAAVLTGLLGDPDPRIRNAALRAQDRSSRPSSRNRAHSKRDRDRL